MTKMIPGLEDIKGFLFLSLVGVEAFAVVVGKAAQELVALGIFF